MKRVVLRNQELKYYEYLGMVSSAVTNHVWNFSECGARNIIQGTDVTTRVGNKIYIESIDWYIKIYPTPGNTNNTGSACRFIIYHDKEANGALPTYVNFFQDNIYNSFRQLGFWPRKSTILMDKLHMMYGTLAATTTGTTTTTTNSGPSYIAMFKQKVGKVMSFSDNSGSITGVSNDSWGIGWCADADNCCNITVSTRIRFRDA